jgi:cell division protein FtsW
VRTLRSPRDPILLGAVALLLMVGAFMVYSASLVVAFNELNDDTYFLSRQLSSIAVGVVAMVFLSKIDYHQWQRFCLPILLLGIVGLVVVLIPGLGITSYGSSRWLRIVPFFQVQPSEYIKLALVIYMANWLASKGSHVGEFFSSSLPFLIILVVICGLVVVEPDFGTTVVIAATSVCIFFLAGANLLHFVSGLVLLSGGFTLVMLSASYRMERINAFLDPWKDVQGTGWHTVQTLIALGSGGLHGLGLGASRQKHSWLVNAHTDAILAVVGEELGFIGTAAVVALFGVVIWRGLRIAYRASDAYGRLLAAGITIMIFWQAAINVAVVTNTVPYTGVTLPFVSFGGSSTVVSLSAVGLLLSISHFRSRTIARRGMPTHGDEVAAGQEPPRRRKRARPAAEPAVAIVGQLEAPISIASHRRGGSHRGRPGGR